MASLARIAWRIGQVLLPEDFEALEEALAEEARSFAEIAGLPSYGWLALEWDAAELSRGVLRVEKARAALPGGRIVPRPAPRRGPSAATSSEERFAAHGRPQRPMFSLPGGASPIA